MKIKKIVDNSTNRTEFNRAYKEYLERKGKIHCSYCGYHKSENCRDKYYGGHEDARYRHPNWKLTSKSTKQWMPKHLVVTTEIVRGKLYTEINF